MWRTYSRVAPVALTVRVADESADTTCFPLFSTAATGDIQPKTGTNLTFNAATGVLGATIFNGPIGTGTATPAAGSFTTLGASGLLTAGAGINLTGNFASALAVANIGQVDAYNGDVRVYSNGPDGSTYGGFLLNARYSDATGTVARLAIASSGAGTLGGTFQWGGGAAIASSNKVRPDYAGIEVDAPGTLTITVQDVYTMIDNFDKSAINDVSASDHANNKITVGDTRPYDVALDVSAQLQGAAAQLEFEAFDISQTTVAITGISEASPGVVTTAGHSFTDGQEVLIEGVVGMVEVNRQIYTVAGADATTFQLNTKGGAAVNTAGYASWSSGGTIALATGILEADRTFSNLTIGSVAAGPYPASLVSGDSVQMAGRNQTNTNDIDLEEAHLSIRGL